MIENVYETFCKKISEREAGDWIKMNPTSQKGDKFYIVREKYLDQMLSEYYSKDFFSSRIEEGEEALGILLNLIDEIKKKIQVYKKNGAHD
jgi:hypothetical protein